jgi:hypothetical protein
VRVCVVASACVGPVRATSARDAERAATPPDNACGACGGERK